MHDNTIFSITDITTAIRHSLESSFPFMWVRGQVTNLSRPSSGHIYFSLQDDNASLSCVWFKGNHKETSTFDPLTGEVFEDGPRPSLVQALENGQEIICAGKLTVYPLRGSYQLSIEFAQDAGLGELYARFEQLRQKLETLGYFASERKRALPVNPTRVAVITAPTGAAIHDFLRIASTRGLGAEIRIYPTLVQGANAPEQILNQLAHVHAEQWAEVIVLIRGGGSLEDLQAFNNENLATSIKNSPIPVLAGIGHEVDFTLADMTADLRAATPTHAAQLLWTDRRELQKELSVQTNKLQRACHSHITRAENTLHTVALSLSAYAPNRRVDTWEQQLGSALHGLHHAIEKNYTFATNFLRQNHQKLLHIPYKISVKESKASQLFERLVFAGQKKLVAASYAVDYATITLDALDPTRPLKRGYSLIYDKNGALIRNAQAVKAGDSLHIIVHEGSMTVTVETTKKGSRNKSSL